MQGLHLCMMPLQVGLYICDSADLVPTSDGQAMHPHREKELRHCRCSTHVQEQIKRAQRAKQDTAQSRQADTPAALFVLVRPERTSVRFELAQRAAFVAILHGFEELGWPAPLGDPDPAR